MFGLVEYCVTRICVPYFVFEYHNVWFMLENDSFTESKVERCS